MRSFCGWMIFLLFLILGLPMLLLAASETGVQELGEQLSFWSVVPFIVLLLAIAVIPLINRLWWEHTRSQTLVAAICGLPIFVYFLIMDYHQLVHTGLEYVSFIIYIGGLFIVAGGIFITGDVQATPKVNTAFLAIGAVLANFVGTTGASMLLIRPMMNTNKERHHILHIPLFFIFIVSNIGGCLTPLGDPPLFLGFLRGVPFAWTLSLFPEWIFAIGILLLIFYLWDERAYHKETKKDIQKDRTAIQPLKIIGKRNFYLLAAILAAVLLTSSFESFFEAIGASTNAELLANLTRDVLIFAIAIVSFKITPEEAHKKNEFTFAPIKEVAVLFAGIFVTMIPALLILQARGASFGISQPWQFFWLTGSLSSFLDNAPTYLTFASLAQGVIAGSDHVVFADLHEFLLHSPAAERLLQAISLGAVFMGANTYIGNGPNFMVRSIVQERGVNMPSFFGYMLYSVGILVPVFILVTLIFFR
jgi:Na+/H+ antiporter NhaD/arsenite permease-like protein